MPDWRAQALQTRDGIQHPTRFGRHRFSTWSQPCHRPCWVGVDPSLFPRSVIAPNLGASNWRSAVWLTCISRRAPEPGRRCWRRKHMKTHIGSNLGGCVPSLFFGCFFSSPANSIHCLTPSFAIQSLADVPLWSSLVRHQ